MRVAIFLLHGHRVALKLERIERILAPGEIVPSGWRRLDLADALRLDASVESPPAPVHRVLLAGPRIALAAGGPLGTAAIEPGWVLPIPGYLFGAGEGVYAGLIQFPAPGSSKGSPAPGPCLLIDDERLAGWGARTEPRGKGGSG